jgi:hypothetical protein
MGVAREEQLEMIALARHDGVSDEAFFRANRA